MIPFEREHIPMINSWYRLRGERTIDVDMLPNLGWLVPGVAALFLYRTDSSLAFIEGLITNPERSSEERHKAIDSLADMLYSVAKGLHFKNVILIIKDEGIKDRAESLGYESIGNYELFMKKGA